MLKTRTQTNISSASIISPSRVPCLFQQNPTGHHQSVLQSLLLHVTIDRQKIRVYGSEVMVWVFSQENCHHRWVFSPAPGFYLHVHLCVDFLIKIVNVPQLPGLLQANMVQIQPINIPKHIAVHVQNKCRGIGKTNNNSTTSGTI